MLRRLSIALPLILAPALALVRLAPAAEGRAAKVPDVVVGPAETEAAPQLDARIEEVTVFSDRARVRRRGRIPFKAGARVVRLPDLPGAVFLDTIRVSATGARVLRVEATPVQRERMAIDQAVKALDELDAANDRAVELDDRAALDEWEVNLLTGLAPAPAVPEEKREGRKGLVIDVGSWWKALDFVGERARGARARLVRLGEERRALGERRNQLRAEIATLDRGGFSSRAVEVVAVLDAGAAGTADVQLEYFVPGASWKPAYDLHFASSRGQVRLETAAVVEQATGEDWDRAALSFSTAIPGRGIDLPELLTWTLGERSELLPQPRARARPPEEPPFPVPPQPKPASEAARAVAADVVRLRLALATEQTARNPSAAAESTVEQSQMRRIKALVAEDMAVAGLDVPRHRSFQGTGAVAPAPAVVAPEASPAEGNEMPEMLSREVATAGEEQEAATERPARRSTLAWQDMLLGSKSPGKSPGKPAPSFTRVPLALYDRPPPSWAPRFSDPYLPAVSAGGFDFVYQAPAPASVPSTRKQIRIPLSSQTFHTTAYYEAAPALATTAFLRARVRNDGNRPLLRGPAVIFGDGELVGVGEIQTTGPSGDIELPLGADQDIRLVRQVVPATKTTGLVFKSDETTYDVQIQIGNYKKQPVTVEVSDQVPRSRNDKIDVKLLGVDPPPAGPMDVDGTLRFRVDVPAGATRTVKLRYQITRPQNWELYQR